MKITEYTVEHFKGMHLYGKTPWQYYAIKLNDNQYYVRAEPTGITVTKSKCMN